MKVLTVFAAVLLVSGPLSGHGEAPSENFTECHLHDETSMLQISSALAIPLASLALCSFTDELKEPLAVDDDEVLLMQKTISTRFGQVDFQPPEAAGVTGAVATSTATTAAQNNTNDSQTNRTVVNRTSTNVAPNGNKTEKVDTVTTGQGVPQHGSKRTNITVENQTTVETKKASKTEGDLARWFRHASKNRNVTNETQAFAHRETITEKVQRESEENVNATHIKRVNKTETITTEVIEVARPDEILSAYICIFFPLGVAWAVFVHLGSQEKHALILMPITLACTTVGFDLANQSLALVMDMPASITACQALAMGIILMGWSFFVDAKEVKEVPRYDWLKWGGTSCVYSIFQLANHIAYKECSLSERTVFLNLCPVFAMGLEFVVLPAALQKTKTFRTKLAMVSMVAAATLFALQTPSFTSSGVLASSLLVTTLVPCRILQRLVIGDSEFNAPISTLAGIDGLVLFLFSAVFMSGELKRFLEFMSQWRNDFSIILLLFLSFVIITVQHVIVLWLIKKGSVPSVLVYQNVAGFIDVTVGNLWFDDQVLSRVGAAVGLAASLLCGIWYSVEAICIEFREREEKEALAKEDESSSTPSAATLLDSERSKASTGSQQ